ncbi:MAG: hypothetical protein ABEJ56_04450 [Candidatus Nanohaloarchaea archaeon]
MNNHFHIQIPDQLEERLDRIVEETGMAKSEIGRRGLMRQLNQLEKELGIKPVAEAEA